MEQNQGQAIKIDLAAVLRERLGGFARLIPTILTAKLERLICQDQLNKLLENNYPREGADFCRGVFDDLDVRIEVVNEHRLPPVENRRVIIVSNHPLGGLDGMALIDYFTRRYGGRVMFVVNDLLMAVKPLAPVFLPINKHGAQSRESIIAIEEVMKSDDPIIIFPAGLVSRQLKKGEAIADLKWRKMFIQKAISYKRDIVPVYFDGRNSDKFYSTARRREKLGLKLNIEMVLLPSEVFKSAGKCFTVNVGDSIAWQSLAGEKNLDACAASIREKVYDMKNELYEYKK